MGSVLTPGIEVIPGIGVIDSVRFPKCLESLCMNTCFLLPLQESTGNHNSGKHNQSRRYMSVRVGNNGMIKSISIATAVIRPMIKLDLDIPQACFRQDVQWTPAIHFQLSTLSGLDLDRVHHLTHALPQQKGTYCLQERNQ